MILMISRFARAVASALAVAVLCASVAPPAEAQQADGPRAAFAPRVAGQATAGQATTGRIGVFLDADCPDVAGAVAAPCSEAPVVTGVVAGGPAAEAGIRPGDRLLSLDGVRLNTEAGRRSLARLRVGVPVRLTVSSSGEEREVRIIPEARRAASRFTMLQLPAPDALPDAPRFTHELQDVQVFRFENDDGKITEFRFRSDSANAGYGSRNGFVVFSEGADGQLNVRAEDLGEGSFRYFFDDERIEPGEIETVLRDLGIARGDGPLRVQVEVNRVGPAPDGESGPARLILENAELAERLQSVRESALSEARQEFNTLRARTEELASRGQVPPQVGLGYSASYRVRAAPVAPGPDDGRLAGAEFHGLTSELADYFGVGQGLLVLRVIPETPAARLGLRGGDVVVEVGTEVGTVKLQSLSEFRRMVAESRAGSAPLEVKWVRKGKELRGTLPST